MDENGIKPAAATIDENVRMTDLLPNEVENNEEAVIDFGIEPTARLPSHKRPTAPRNLPKKKNKCCIIL